MGVYELSGAGSIKTGRTLYKSMNAGNQYGAMVPIAQQSGAGLSGVTFNNIPQTFQDLFIVVAGLDAATSGVSGYSIAINNDFSTTKSDTTLEGNGGSAYSTRSSGNGGWAVSGFPGATGIPGSSQVHILNYTNTTTFKTAIMRYAADRNGSGVTGLRVSLNRQTTAIARLDFFPFTSPFGTGTTITLYGIRAVSS
jgi:hypothetical protein